MKYGVKYQYPYPGSIPTWGHPALSFAQKCFHLDGSFITDNINEAFLYQNELQAYDLTYHLSRIWWVEERNE